MPPRIVERLIAQIHRQYRVAEDVEITLEANPTSSEASRFRDFRAAGVNRLSMGIQSLDPASLTFLGRTHSVTEALHAWEAARSIFPRHSFDMIYARPGQTALQWERELQQALTHAGDHLSLYQLTIEPGTAFAQQYRKGTLTLPPDDEAVALYSLTREMMEAAGRPWYEISNYAAPGEACRHNLNYWRSVEYLGIGPGAHGRVMHQGIRHATVTERSPEKWLERVQQHGHGRVECTPLTQTERAEEVLLMGLRLREGIHAEDFAQRAGMKLLEAINEAALSMLVREGLLTFDANRLATTTSGILVLNRVIAELAA
jgi:oxygen-independent coproporphyrinogen-3 oxidase